MIPSTIIAEPSPVPKPRKSIRPPCSCRGPASLRHSSFTGLSNAAAKSNPNQPGRDYAARLAVGHGAPAQGNRWLRGHTASRSPTPSPARSSASRSKWGQKQTLGASFCPVARILTWVPPTSTASTFMRSIPDDDCGVNSNDPNVIVQNSPSQFCKWSGIDDPSVRTFAHPG